MLVLSRKEGEKIVIEVGETRIVLKVVETAYKHCRIGIDAPRDVHIWRQELLETPKESE